MINDILKQIEGEILQKSTEVYIGSGSDLVINTKHAIGIAKSSIIKVLEQLIKRNNKLMSLEQLKKESKERYQEKFIVKWSDIDNINYYRFNVDEFKKGVDNFEILEFHLEELERAYELGYNFAREEIKVTGECYPTVKARELLEMCNLTNKE